MGFWDSPHAALDLMPVSFFFNKPRWQVYRPVDSRFRSRISTSVNNLIISIYLLICSLIYLFFTGHTLNLNLIDAQWSTNITPYNVNKIAMRAMSICFSLFCYCSHLPLPTWQFWDSGGVKLESLCNFSIVGCQWTVNCLLGEETRVYIA